MRRLGWTIAIFLAVLVVDSPGSAKGSVDRITIQASSFDDPVEITDPDVLECTI